MHRLRQGIRRRIVALAPVPWNGPLSRTGNRRTEQDEPRLPKGGLFHTRKQPRTGRTVPRTGEEGAIMAETQEPTAEERAAQEEPHGTDWKAEARKWEERAKANKAKADQWDAQEEAGKTELQKAQELAAKYKRQLDEAAAAKKRGEQVKAAAEKYGVDSDMLARMGGDVDENAQWLKSRAETSERRYPTTRDRGESSKTSKADPMREAARLMFSRNN